MSDVLISCLVLMAQSLVSLEMFQWFEEVLCSRMKVLEVCL